ncbi:hypothetical protein AMTRI_Chr02g259640 [Amborella trichopoda]
MYSSKAKHIGTVIGIYSLSLHRPPLYRNKTPISVSLPPSHFFYVVSKALDNGATSLSEGVFGTNQAGHLFSLTTSKRYTLSLGFDTNLVPPLSLYPVPLSLHFLSPCPMLTISILSPCCYWFSKKTLSPSQENPLSLSLSLKKNPRALVN